MISGTDYELYTFFASVAAGAVFSVVCEAFKVFRGTARIVFVSDILMWMCGYAFFVFFTEKFTNGIVRWYMPAGALSGGVICRFTVGRKIYAVFCRVTEKSCAFFCFIFKYLLTAAHFLCKMLVYTRIKCIKNKTIKVDEGNNEKTSQIQN